VLGEGIGSFEETGLVFEGSNVSADECRCRGIGWECQGINYLATLGVDVAHEHLVAAMDELLGHGKPNSGAGTSNNCDRGHSYASLLFWRPILSSGGNQ
jgi:hypothetical protein